MMRVEKKGVLIGLRNGKEFRIQYSGSVFGMRIAKDQEFRMTDHLVQRFQKHANELKSNRVEDVLVFQEHIETNSNVIITRFSLEFNLIQGICDSGSV